MDLPNEKTVTVVTVPELNEVNEVSGRFPTPALPGSGG